MNFTTNQNRQLYVANAYNSTVNGSSAVGTIGGVKVVDTGLGKELHFLYKGADTVLKSDRIQLNNLTYCKPLAAADMVVPLKKVKVALDSTVNGGNPVTGQDYLLNIVLRAFYLDTDNQEYYKFGAVHATAAMTSDKKEFYKAMVASLNANFAREVGATATSNPYLEFSAGTAGSEDGIYITEKEQDWTLGIEPQRRVEFDVFPQTVYTGGSDVIWGTVTDVTPAKYVEDTDSSSSTYQQMIPNPAIVVGTNAIGNGKKIADLEYFCMGERGDQYRNMGWPNVISTTYLVDPAKQYNVLELHFAFTDTGVNSYRSEKDITVVADTTAALNGFIGAINAAAGTSIPVLG